MLYHHCIPKRDNLWIFQNQLLFYLKNKDKRLKFCSVQCAPTTCISNTLIFILRKVLVYFIQFPIDILSKLLIKVSSQIFIILCFYHAVRNGSWNWALFFLNTCMLFFVQKNLKLKCELSSKFEDNFNTLFWCLFVLGVISFSWFFQSRVF